AALVLVLATFAAGREVIVSRGELVEIGGSFRIPEILAAAGTRLVEVGTTNRTRLADYERALTPETALLLKVHTSNYRITGFVEEAGAAALAGLARSRGLLLLVDEGSGLLRPHRAPQLADHPSFTALLAAGADLVCGSGDKLLGGPQAGLLCGRAELVARCHRHPLYRALRPDRTVFAALDGVLRAHLAGDGLPLDRLWPEPAAHRRRLERLAARLGAAIVPGDAYVGGGAAPERPIPGEILALPGGERLAARLRTGEPPAVGYAREGRCLLDLRTLDPADDELLAAAVERARAGLDEG
ncbi:MAG: L-seryl-tRNA(Sec) selenium transferase, partial [Acidobacteriota bacterium]|nr:L-seryl-tRNA(Sec) selenium transferase [Acidobacteriota bacterium]